MNNAEHLKEQTDALFQIFGEAQVKLHDIARDGYTSIDALGDVLRDYGWVILSQDREAELYQKEQTLGALKAIQGVDGVKIYIPDGEK